MSTTHPLTGRKVLIIAVACFGTVIAANLAMLFAATGTFPGLVVENSYVASQKWQVEIDAQRALGWDVAVKFKDGRLTFLPNADGEPVRNLDVVAIIGRPTSAAEDRTVDLLPAGSGYAAVVDLPAGAWRVEIATRSGPAFRIGANLMIAEER